MQHIKTLRRQGHHQSHTMPRPVTAIITIGTLLAQYAAAEDHQPMQPTNRTELGVAYWLAFDQMLKGKSDYQSWAVVTVSLNVALILAERGFGTEYVPYLVKALDGSQRARERAEKSDGITWRFDGDAITAIRQALEIHDEQATLATKSDMRDALNIIRAREQAGNTYAVQHVVEQAAA